MPPKPVPGVGGKQALARFSNMAAVGSCTPVVEACLDANPDKGRELAPACIAGDSASMAPGGGGAVVEVAVASTGDDECRPPRLSLLQIFTLFLGFGVRAFGGPVAQIALMKTELVVEKRWMTVPKFNRVLAVYQVCVDARHSTEPITESTHPCTPTALPVQSSCRPALPQHCIATTMS
jgi:hypothetical protein